MNSYDIKILEKAENWYFYETVKAENEKEAIELVRKLYAKQKDFVVVIL